MTIEEKVKLFFITEYEIYLVIWKRKVILLVSSPWNPEVGIMTCELSYNLKVI